VSSSAFDPQPSSPTDEEEPVSNHVRFLAFLPAKG
jgi:hypothetical protein